MFIKEAVPKLIKNSRGKKSIQFILKTYQGEFQSSAPSGKSKGIHEVDYYNDRGILWSFKLLKEFCSQLKHKNIFIKKIDDLEKIEKLLKKFEKDHGRLGGNVWYVIEACFLRAGAKEANKEVWELISNSFNFKKIKMPRPVGNCIGGGLHSKDKNSTTSVPDFQEFLLIPSESSFEKCVAKNLKAYKYAERLLRRKEKRVFIKKNDENAYKTRLKNEEVLEVLERIKKQFNVDIGLDVAAVSFFKDGYYEYKNKVLTRDRKEQINYMAYLIKKFGIFYVEDPLDEEDFSGFLELKNSVKKNVLITGDDLTTTNPKRLQRAIRSKAINAIIVKPNQIGSLLKVKEVVELCRKHKIKMIFSHRSGETLDDFLGDLVVGFQGQFIKSGIYGQERLVKLKRVIEIERSLKK